MNLLSKVRYNARRLHARACAWSEKGRHTQAGRIVPTPPCYSLMDWIDPDHRSIAHGESSNYTVFAVTLHDLYDLYDLYDLLNTKRNDACGFHSFTGDNVNFLFYNMDSTLSGNKGTRK